MPFVLLTGYSGGEEGAFAFAVGFCLPILLLYGVLLSVTLFARRSSGLPDRKARASRAGRPSRKAIAEGLRVPDAAIAYPRTRHSVRLIVVLLLTLPAGFLGGVTLISALLGSGSIIDSMGRIFVSHPDEGYIPLALVAWGAIGLIALLRDSRAMFNPTFANIERAGRAYAVFWVHLVMMFVLGGCTAAYSLTHIY